MCHRTCAFITGNALCARNVLAAKLCSNSSAANERGECIRSFGQPFKTPYESYVIRTWAPVDRDAAASVIRVSLKEYGLGWEPDGADSDAVFVEKAYGDNRAEFWVIEQENGQLVGTAALRPAERSPAKIAEIRKMYLAKSARGKGLGGFLLAALEERAKQLGYATSLVETASVLSEAVSLYTKRQYIPVSGVDTLRCDMALQKGLVDHSENGECPDEQVVVVDHDGCTMCYVSREKARRHRLLYRGLVALLLTKDGSQAFISRRSWRKANYPGALDIFVAGAVRPFESLHEAASRELYEELGLHSNDFEWHPLWDGVHVCDTGKGDRCCMSGFVARAKKHISSEDVKFVDGEVTECCVMNLDQVLKANLPSPMWAHVRSLAEQNRLSSCALRLGPFFGYFDVSKR